MNTIDQQIEEALQGVPPEQHQKVLKELLANWYKLCGAGKVPPGTMWAASVLIENRLERLNR